MTQYAHASGGLVDIPPTERPKRWENVSGLQHSDDARLIELGWYPVEDVIPTFDPATETLDQNVTYQVHADRIVRTYTARPMTQDELDAVAEEEAKQQRRNKPDDPNPNKPAVQADIAAINAILRDNNMID